MQNALVPVSAGGIRGSGLFCGYFYRIQEAHAAQIPDRKAVQPGGVTAEKLQTTGSKYTGADYITKIIRTFPPTPDITKNARLQPCSQAFFLARNQKFNPFAKNALYFGNL